MAGVEQFDDKFLGNRDVPQVGTKAGVAPKAQQTNDVTRQAGVQHFDPTANMRVETKVKMAEHARSTTPSWTVKRPKGVDSFNDHGV